MKKNKLSKSDCWKIKMCVSALRFMSAETRQNTEIIINDDFAERGSPYRVKIRGRSTILLLWNGEVVLDFSDKNWKKYINDLPEDVCEVEENEKADEEEVQRHD